MIYHERLSKMSNEELIAEAREYAPTVGSNYDAELLEGLADRLEAERGFIQSLAKWVDVAEDASSVDIACEASTALEAATAEPEWEYGRDCSPYGVDEWDSEHAARVAVQSWRGSSLVRRRPAGPWLPVEGGEQR